MANQNLIKTAEMIRKLAEKVTAGLGSGFVETVFQNALAIEFRKGEIEYLKEVNIEIFYKGESVGVDRPDFIITKAGPSKDTIILELKVADKINDGNRIQLKSYCTSFPLNNNPVLNNFIGGILLAFPQNDMEGDSEPKIVVVDNKFNIILDDQEELDKKTAEEKEKLKAEKKKEKK